MVYVLWPCGWKISSDITRDYFKVRLSTLVLQASSKARWGDLLSLLTNRTIDGDVSAPSWLLHCHPHKTDTSHPVYIEEDELHADHGPGL